MTYSSQVRLRSLGVRLLVPLLVLIGATFAVHAWLSYRATRKHFESLVSAEAHHYATLVMRATHDRMLVDKELDVQRTINYLAEDGRVIAIRLYDPEGRIVQSAADGEVGTRVRRDTDEPCISCHRGTLQTTRDVQTMFGNTPALRHLAVIPNEKSCAGAQCHASVAQQSVLGLLDVELTMGPLQAAVASTRRQTIATVIGLVLLTSLVTAGLVRQLVHKPLRKLKEGTRRLAAGDLASRIDMEASEELAALARDINQMATEVQAARHELAQWSQQLEEKVVSKSDELRRAQGQVVQMERMASLGKLSATVAHELNNPLSGILMCARLVERELADHELPEPARDEVVKNLRLIQQECSRCGSIVQNLLLFARHSDGAPMGPVDLDEVAERSLMLIRHRTQLSDIELEFQPMRGDPTMIGDGGQLEQAMVALLVNAIEAMTGPDGSGGQLALRLSGDADTATITISDTGVGIHPDVMPQIFEPFFSTKHQESGVGLGLAVVFGIVQRHAGTIDVASEPGKGTRFSIRLPRRPPHDAGSASGEFRKPHATQREGEVILT